MELRNCDFRNAKYQGETIDKKPAGFGLVLDEHYTIVLSKWNKANTQGPFCTFFGNSSILYGDAIDDPSKLMVFCCSEFKIYKLGKIKIVDCVIAKYLLKLQQRLVTPKSTQNQKRQSRLVVADQRNYKNGNYEQLLTQLLQRRVPAEYMSYQSFIKGVFKAQHRDLLNIYQTSSEFRLSLRNNGIFIRLLKKKDLITAMGFNSNEKSAEIGRRYTYYRDNSVCSVEEFIQAQPATLIQFQICNQNCKDKTALIQTATNMGIGLRHSNSLKYDFYNQKEQDKNRSGTSQPNRPLECIKSLREHYKRSLAFVNEYLNLGVFYKQKNEAEKVIICVLSLRSGKYAQTQLQNNGYKLDQDENPIINIQNQVRPLQATPGDIKKQLDKTLSGKGRRTSNTFNYDNSLSFTQIKTPDKVKNNQSPERSTNINRRNYNYTPSRTRNEPTDFNPELNTSAYHDRSKSRQFRYLDAEDQNQVFKQDKRNRPKLKDSEYRPVRETPVLSRKSPVQYRFRYTED